MLCFFCLVFFFHNVTLAVNEACSRLRRSNTQLVAGRACEGRQRTGCGRALWQHRKLLPSFALPPHLQPQLPTVCRLSCGEQWKRGGDGGRPEMWGRERVQVFAQDDLNSDAAKAKTGKVTLGRTPFSRRVLLWGLMVSTVTCVFLKATRSVGVADNQTTALQMLCMIVPLARLSWLKRIKMASSLEMWYESCDIFFLLNDRASN